MLKMAPKSTRDAMKLERTEIYGKRAVVFDLNVQGHVTHVIKLQNSFKDFWISCTRKHTDECFFIINVADFKNPG